VDSTLSDEQLEAIIGKYSGIVTGQGGEVQAAGKWDKRRLAYEVMGRREGIYILMYFTGEAAVANELDRVFRIGDEVLRHLITRVEPQHIETFRIEQPQPTAKPTEAVAEEAAQEVVEPVTEAPAVETEPAVEEPVETPEEAVTEEVAVETAPEGAPEETPQEAPAEEEPAAQEQPEETEGKEAKE
jgi:small subunit ribosomal protein S6